MKKLFTSLVVLFVFLVSFFQEVQAQRYDNMDRLSLTLDRLSVRIVRSASSSIIVKRMDNGDSPVDVTAMDGTLNIQQRKIIRTESDSRQIEIQVPEGCVLDITMNSGDLSIDQVAGTFHVFLRKGDITANVSPTSSSRFESESGRVNVKVYESLRSNLHVGAGSGHATVDFAGQPLNAGLEMKSFYPSGSIKAPFEFKEVHISRNYGPDTIVKRLDLGDPTAQVTMATGGGTIQVIP